MHKRQCLLQCFPRQILRLPSHRLRQHWPLRQHRSRHRTKPNLCQHSSKPYQPSEKHYSKTEPHPDLSCHFSQGEHPDRDSMRQHLRPRQHSNQLYYQTHWELLSLVGQRNRLAQNPSDYSLELFVPSPCALPIGHILSADLANLNRHHLQFPVHWDHSGCHLVTPRRFRADK